MEEVSFQPRTAWHGSCEVAGWQSLATHPGAEAAMNCSRAVMSCGGLSEVTGGIRIS